MPLILTRYVSVSNCLNYYLRKPFSLSPRFPVISLGRSLCGEVTRDESKRKESLRGSLAFAETTHINSV